PVDLAAAEEERVDAALGCAVEQFDPAIGEKVMSLRAQDRDTNFWLAVTLVARAEQHGASGRDRRGGADRDMAHAVQKTGDGRDKQFAALALGLHRAQATCLRRVRKV